jgi:hypothetical protein
MLAKLLQHQGTHTRDFNAERCKVLASSSKKLRFDRATGSKGSLFLATHAIT